MHDDTETDTDARAPTGARNGVRAKALALANRRLATHFATVYRDRAERVGIGWLDLCQQASLGLVVAANRYDERTYPDVPFAAFAKIYIRKYITLAIEEAFHAPIAIEILPDVLSEPPEEIEEPSHTLCRLRDAIELLPRGDKRILVRRFGLDGGAPWTREKIASHWRLTEYAVRKSLSRSVRAVERSMYRSP